MASGDLEGRSFAGLYLVNFFSVGDFFFWGADQTEHDNEMHVEIS